MSPDTAAAITQAFQFGVVVGAAISLTALAAVFLYINRRYK